MPPFTLENPVFAAYLASAAVLVIKVMAQGWMTVIRMTRARAGFASPEDLRKTPLNPAPDPVQLEANDHVDRSRRMHRNDLENIPAFWAAGLVFVAIEPPEVWAYLFFAGFVAARLIHSVVYAAKANHEVRAIFYTIGSVIVIAMALWSLGALLA